MLVLHVGASTWATLHRHALPRTPVGERVDVVERSSAVPVGPTPADTNVVRRPGEPGLVVLWATWCRACMQVWRQLVASRDAGHPIPVTAIALGDDAEEIRGYTKRRIVPAGILRSPQTTPGRFGVRTIPLILALDGENRLVAAFAQLNRKRTEQVARWIAASKPSG